MDDSVRRAMARWPDVPAVHGWLALDESGRWRLKGEPVTHPGLITFINRNYDHDDAGRWFFQNGPQRGYVRLDYTPWVLYVDGAGRLFCHTGRPVASITGARIDEQGNLLLATGAGPGLVETGSLAAVADWLETRSGAAAGVDALEAADTDAAPDLCLRFAGTTLPVGFIRRADVPGEFGFEPDPRPEEAG